MSVLWMSSSFVFSLTAINCYFGSRKALDSGHCLLNTCDTSLEKWLPVRCSSPSYTIKVTFCTFISELIIFNKTIRILGSDLIMSGNNRVGQTRVANWQVIAIMFNFMFDQSNVFLDQVSNYYIDNFMIKNFVKI